MAQMRNLPTYVALKATHGDAPFKFLGVEDDGSVAYSTAKVVSDQAKFAIEFTATGLAHIRSCFNNKYWVRSSESSFWIVAGSDDPVEDESLWNCTLFRPLVNQEEKTVSFVHIQLGKPVGRRDLAPDRDMYLCIEPFATTTAISTLVDYNTITIMPKYVAIKGVNDKYLSLNDEVALTFMSDDLGAEGNAYEIHSSSDGHVFLEPAFVPRKHGFWRAEEGGWVTSRAPLSGSEDPTDPNMLFSVIKISKNVIALRCVGNNRICRLFQYEGSTFAELQATATGLIREVQLQVIEPVIERRVNVFQFDLDRARIYDRIPLTYTEGQADNPTDSEQEFTLNFTYTKTRTSSWNTSKSWFVNGSFSITSKIPFIGETTIEVGGGYSEQYDIGGTIEESEEVGSTYTVKVPKWTNATVSAVATRGTCDVPFSYVQIDRMVNGESVTTTLSDGIYTGMNAYQFKFVVRYEPSTVKQPVQQDP